MSAVASSSAHPHSKHAFVEASTHSLRDRARNVSPRNNSNVTLELPKTRACPSSLGIVTTLARRWRAAHCCSSLSPDRSEASLRSLSPPPLPPKLPLSRCELPPSGASSPHSSRCARYPHSSAILLSCVADFFHEGASETRCVQRCGVAVVRAGRTETSVVLLEREHTTVTRWKGKIRKKSSATSEGCEQRREREREIPGSPRDSTPPFTMSLHRGALHRPVQASWGLTQCVDEPVTGLNDKTLRVGVIPRGLERDKVVA